MILIYFGAFIFFVGGLIFSTNLLNNQITKLSLAIKISPLVIGTTIVAIGTSLPELVVSVIALINNDEGLALGNIIGSNITNVLLIFGVGIIFGNLKIGKMKTQWGNIILLFVSTIFIFVTEIYRLPYFGILLIFAAISFTYLEYYWAIRGRTTEDVSIMSVGNITRFRTKDIVLLIVSLIGVLLGGIGLVVVVEKLSELSGYSTTILGLSLTAVATSLPELLTTIISQRSNQVKITSGNILGSNVYNLLLIGGITLTASQAGNYQSLPVIDWLFFSMTTLLLYLLIRVYMGKVIPRRIGYTLLCLYVLYLISLSIKV